MTEITDFTRLCDELGQRRTYKKAELEPLQELVGQLKVDEAIRPAFCAGLLKLKWTDSVELLQRKWLDIPTELRHKFIRWQWEGKEAHVVIGACLAMAAKLRRVDPTSAMEFMNAAMAGSATPSGKGHVVRGVWHSWLHPDGDDSLPIEELTWQDMQPTWRWNLIEGVVDSLLSGQKARNTDLPSIKGKVLDWIDSLSNAHSDKNPEMHRLVKLKQRLTRIPPSRSPQAEHGAQVPSTDLSLAAKRVGQTQTVSTLSSEAASLLRELERYDRTMRQQLESFGKQVSQLTDDREVLEADLSQLRRDIQGERTTVQQLKGELARAHEELAALGRAHSQLQEKLDATQKELTDEQRHVNELEQRLKQQEQSHRDMLDAHREDARRVFSQSIAQAITMEVQHVRELEQEPASEAQARFLRSLLKEMFKRLRVLNIPIEG